MIPSDQHPVKSPPVESGRDPVNRWDITPKLRLYHMAQLTLRKGDYLSGPELIRSALKGMGSSW